MHVLQALSAKRSYNLFWKTLAQQEDCMKKSEQGKVDQMVKIYIKTTKTKTKHVIFGTYRQFKNITLKKKGQKLKPFIINKLNVLFLHITNILWLQTIEIKHISHIKKPLSLPLNHKADLTAPLANVSGWTPYG